jgi:RNA 3'-terminal phosphate cyclase (ATP)
VGFFSLIQSPAYTYFLVCCFHFCFALDDEKSKNKRVFSVQISLERLLNVLDIDGSQKSGSGTILRLSVALAAILGEPLHIFNIREKRSQPGLRPQHLEAVLAAARLCDAQVQGATLGSREIWFTPSEIRGGAVESEIGTAGSIPMLLLTILPMCAYAKRHVSLRVAKGGTDVRNAPTVNYLKHVLLPMLGRMGLRATLAVQKYGYYPKGMGEIILEVDPCPNLSPICLERFGELQFVKGISVCTFLADRKVAERQAAAAEALLKSAGLASNIEIVNDTSNPLQKGSSLVLWAETDSGVLLGGDAIGELGKPSEKVGREAAGNLLKETATEATVDSHLADMLVPYVALAQGSSVYLSGFMTEHLDTNIWLAEKILGTKFNVTRVENLHKVEVVK